jgi:hypothetical protein
MKMLPNGHDRRNCKRNRVELNANGPPFIAGPRDAMDYGTRVRLRYTHKLLIFFVDLRRPNDWTDRGARKDR